MDTYNMAVMAKWVVYWGEICSKNIIKKSTGFQESTHSGHRMTTGFGPFELLTRAWLFLPPSLKNFEV